MARVLLDTWTFEQYLVDASKISEQAIDAIERAANDNQVYVSALSYLIVRDRAMGDGVPRDTLHDLDRRMKKIRILPLDNAAIVTIDRIPRVANLLVRTIAAIAIAENYTLLTHTTAVCCPGLDFILARPGPFTVQ